MARLPTLEREKMSPEQVDILDEIKSKGGRLGGPYTAYIRIPKFMKLNQEMGNYLRSNTLDPRLRQLAAIITIRYWGARFAWAMNARDALEHGVSPEVVKSINQRQRPVFERKDEEVIYDVVNELLLNKVISDETYERSTDAFGEETIVDLIVTTGFFSMVSMTLVSFDVDPPSDAEQILID